MKDHGGGSQKARENAGASYFKKSRQTAFRRGHFGSLTNSVENARLEGAIQSVLTKASLYSLKSVFSGKASEARTKREFGMSALVVGYETAEAQCILS